MARSEKSKAVEPYQPDYSPSASPPSAARGNEGCLGCLQRGMVLTFLSGIILAVLIVSLFLLGVYQTQNTATSIFDAVSNICLVNCGDSVTQINTGPLLQAIEQQGFLEGARANNNLPNIYASNEWPGLLPGRRSLRYNAFVTVTAGIDLENVSPQDIRTAGNTVTVVLPPAQVRDCILDEAASSYFDRRCSAIGVVDVGCGGLEAELRAQALIASATADHDVLLEDAFASGAEVIQNLLLGFDGVEQVVIQQAQVDTSRYSPAGTCVNHLPEDQRPPTPSPEG
ncbi:MAG: DUF4230 domain-containing protein [Anaerolineales bacterium]